MTTKATIGSISHGTLRIKDLLEAFTNELEHLDTEKEYAAYITEARNADGYEAMNDILEKITDLLDVFAPPYCYFGALEGDGSDFGFWPSMDALEDLPRVADPTDVEGMSEDCVFVNDHGNVTVYAADGSVIWDCV